MLLMLVLSVMASVFVRVNGDGGFQPMNGEL